MTTTAEYDLTTAQIITQSKKGDMIPLFRAGTLYALSINIGAQTEVSILDLGIVHDPNQKFVSANTTAYLAALKSCAGTFKLVHPAGVTVWVTGLNTGALSGVFWQINGTVKLADSTNTNLLDISGWTNFVIEGSGTLDGNKGMQQGGYPKAVGGIVSNVAAVQNTTTALNSAGTSITIPPMPVYSSVPSAVSDGIIRGITITNCFNWPISIGGILRVCVNGVTMCNSNSSPQFFQSAQDSCIINSHIYSINDAGFVFYRGNNYCFAINNNVHNCNDGIGVYCEYDMLPGDSYIGISNNIVYENVDSGIGITTGLTPPALIQKHIIVSDNILYNNNTGGRNGGGSIGIVGATGVAIKNNIIYGDGQTATSGTPYSMFIDGASTFISIEGNQVSSAGSAKANGIGIWVAGTNYISIRNNTFYNLPDSPYMTAGVGGNFGAAGCIYENNVALGKLVGYLDEIQKNSNVQILQRSNDNNELQITQGVNLLSGDLVISSGLLATTNTYGLAATGTTQATAQLISAQNSIVITSSSTETLGLILPEGDPTGVLFTISNRSGNNILVYPPVSGQIEGLGENVPVTIKDTNNLHVYSIYSSIFSGGQWFGWQDGPANVSE